MPANQGEVEIVLDGETRVLRSTLRAAKEVSASTGGFMGAYQRLAAFDLEAYVSIVAAGLGKRPRDPIAKDLPSVEEAVYATGMAPLTAPLSQFVQFLSNGGKEPAEEEGAPKGEA